MKEGKADVGFVVDPDVDRLAIVCENGEMFVEEYTLVAVGGLCVETYSRKYGFESKFFESVARCHTSVWTTI